MVATFLSFRHLRAALLCAICVGVLVLVSVDTGRGGRHARSAWRTVADRVITSGNVSGGRWGGWGALLGAKDTPDEAALRGWEIARAMQHTGTGARVNRFLEKAKRGEPFTVAAIGGSVSKGRGLVDPSPHDHVHPPSSPGADTDADGGPMGASTLYSPENLHVLVFEWLNATFPHPQNRFVNGAQGGVGAGYFAWCFKEHIDDDPDLILVELGINDLLRLDIVPKYEHLIRSLLELDSGPAIINIETFTTLFPSLVSSSALHGDVLAFYDVPSLSIRDILLPRILDDPDAQLPRWFRTGGDVALGDDKVREWGGVPVDLMHISAKGHALAAGLVINYLGQQLAYVSPGGILGRLSAKRLRHQAQRVYDVPPTSLTVSFNPADTPGRRPPICRTMNSPRKHNRVSGTDGAAVSAGDMGQGVLLNPASKGWTQWAWAEKRYLVAREPGAVAVFDFVTGETEAPASSADADDGPIPDPIAEYEPHAAGHEEIHEYDAQAVEDEGWERRRRRSRRGGQRMGGRTRAERRGRMSSTSSHDKGTVAIGYQRSAHYGLGSVWCWVDDDRAGGTRLDGYWNVKERNMGMVDKVATGLAPGRHRLQCELLDETLDPQGRREFRLFAIMHD